MNSSSTVQQFINSTIVWKPGWTVRPQRNCFRLKPQDSETTGLKKESHAHDITPRKNSQVWQSDCLNKNKNTKYSSKSSGTYGENSEGNEIWTGKAQEESLEKQKHGSIHIQNHQKNEALLHLAINELDPVENSHWHGG